MFYSEDILQKRSGKFGKIWLAATRMCKLTRREIASVCVSKSCDEVLAYIEKRVPASRPGEKSPRLSLYLSAQLMFGLSRIHEKQIAFLLLDACNVFIRVRMIPVHDINLLEEPRADLVTMPKVTEDTPMIIDTSFDEFLQMKPPEGNLKEQFLGISSSSDHSSTATRRSRRDKRTSDTDSAVTVADIEKITLVEPPPAMVDTPLSPIPIPRELDLPPMNGQEMELFLETMPEARLSVEDLLPTSTPMHKEHDAQKGATLASPILEEPREKTPAKRTTTVDAVRTRAVPPSPGVTQIITSPLARRRPTRASLQLELTPLLPSPARQRQRKQPVFADKETQIPKQDLKQNLLTSSDTRKRFELNEPRAEGPEALFNRPSRKGHRPEVSTGLWAATAKFRSGIPEDQLPSIESPSESSLSEEGRDIGMDESTLRRQILPRDQSFMDLDMVQLDTNVTMVDAQLQTSLQVPEPEFKAPSPIPLVTPTQVGRRRSRKRTLEESVERLRKTSSGLDLHGTQISRPSIEHLRDASASRLAGSLNLDETLILDDSRKSRADKSSSKKKPRLSEADLDEVQPESIAVSRTPSASTVLYDLPEESVISDQSLLHVTPADLLEHEDLLLDNITETIHSQDSYTTTFSTVCPPPDTDRKIAARSFMALLNLLKRRKVKAKQRKLFGEIYIRLQE